MHDPIGAEPFKVSVPDAVLDDLRERLSKTRWPLEAKAPPWTYGASLAYMKDICSYWCNHYDWRKAEALINKYPNYLVSLGGKKVHFIVEKGSGSNPQPLIMTHGWPGSIVEFLDIIEPLAHPERFGGDEKDAFTVVLPSLPGYGFSEAPDVPMKPRDVAHLWDELMVKVLGCESYVAQGGDWGGIITSWLAFDHPEKLKAVHLNICGFIPEVTDDAPMSAEEQEWMDRYNAHRAKEIAYHQIHGTKPQTLSYGLQDSPSGCAAWILEKFHGWSDHDQDVKDLPFDKDHLLTNVMLYWLNGSNAPTWFYCSLLDGSGRRPPLGEKVQVPVGFLLFPKDIALPPPTSWLERSYANIVQRNDSPDGGHFAAFEKGEFFTNDVRNFFQNYR